MAIWQRSNYWRDSGSPTPAAYYFVHMTVPPLLTDWFNSDRTSAIAAVLGAVAAIVTAIVTCWLVRTATHQLGAIAVERIDRWKPVVGFSAEQTDRHGTIRVSAINAGPGTALGLTAQITVLHESVEFSTGDSAFAAILPVNSSVTLDGNSHRIGAYFDSQRGNLGELKVAELRAAYSDPLGHNYESSADLVFVNGTSATDTWQLRDILPAVAKGSKPVQPLRTQPGNVKTLVVDVRGLVELTAPR